MEGQKKNVYINPNFPQSTFYKPQEQIPITRVHLNPAFSTSHKKQNIHVNPNFYRHTFSSHTITSTCSDSVISKSQSQEDYTNDIPASVSDTLISTSRYKLTRKFTKPSDATQSNIVQYNAASTSAQSYYQRTSNRYQLTSKNNDSSQVAEHTAPQPDVNAKRTVALNKYKSVRLSDIKKKIDTRTKSTLAKPTCLGDISSLSNKTQLNKQYTSNKFKSILCNKNSYYKTLLSPGTKKLMNSRYKLNKINKIADYSKINKLKKCNIPCPLYRKFGKCLRLEKGTCTYIHEKKHVTVCKKFIKGICFDKNCLLSHEVNKKKMPTCAFYLRGLCAKDNCPYLHVKLNDSTKICRDFMNGFCEKGDNCSRKHICTVMRKRNSRGRKLTNYHKVQNKITREKDSGAICGVDEENKLKNTKCTNSDRRYFKDNAENEQVCEIKPTRAKLGTLPSFIKL